MVSPYVKKISKETGMGTDEVKELWAKSKAAISEKVGKEEEEFSKADFESTEEHLYSMLGLNEYTTDPSKFLRSGKSAKEFIETMVSGNFQGSINPDDGGIVPPEEEEEKSDEEESDNEYGPTFTTSNRPISRGKSESSVTLSQDEASSVDSLNDEQFGSEIDKMIESVEKED